MPTVVPTPDNIAAVSCKSPCKAFNALYYKPPAGFHDNYTDCLRHHCRLTKCGYAVVDHASLVWKNCSVRADGQLPSDVLDVLAKYADLFPDDLPDGLPPTRDTFHTIPLEADKLPAPAKKQYCMSQLEFRECKQQVNELLRKGWIRHSLSPYGSPVLFV